MFSGIDLETRNQPRDHVCKGKADQRRHQKTRSEKRWYDDEDLDDNNYVDADVDDDHNGDDNDSDDDAYSDCHHLIKKLLPPSQSVSLFRKRGVWSWWPWWCDDDHEYDDNVGDDHDYEDDDGDDHDHGCHLARVHHCFASRVCDDDDHDDVAMIMIMVIIIMMTMMVMIITMVAT